MTTAEAATPAPDTPQLDTPQLEVPGPEGPGPEGPGPDAAEPEAAEPGDSEPGDWEPGDSEPGAEAGPRRRLRRALLPAVVAALLAGGGLFLHLGAQVRGSADTANVALTDAAAGSRVTGDVAAALARVFSYAPTDTDATVRAAGLSLDAAAATQYRALMDQLRAQVAEQKLTLTTRVVRVGLVRLDADSAQLLVFLDQTSQRVGRAASTVPAQLSVTARLDGGHWRITDLRAR